MASCPPYPAKAIRAISLPTAHARREAFARRNAALDYVFHDAEV